MCAVRSPALLLWGWPGGNCWNLAGHGGVGGGRGGGVMRCVRVRSPALLLWGWPRRGPLGPVLDGPGFRTLAPAILMLRAALADKWRFTILGRTWPPLPPCLTAPRAARSLDALVLEALHFAGHPGRAVAAPPDVERRDADGVAGGGGLKC